MAVNQAESRLKAIDWATIESINELRREATLLTKGGRLAVGVYTGISTAPHLVEVAVFRRRVDNCLPVGDPIESGIINVTQHRSVLMELLLALLETAKKKLDRQ